MPVLFAGGEEICFPNRDGVTLATSYYRADYSRHSLWVLNYLETPNVGPQDDVWITLQWGWHIHHQYPTFVDHLQLRDASGNIIASMQFATGLASIRASCNGLIGEAWPHASQQSMRKVDLHYRRHQSSGEFAVYTDNQLRSRVTGNTDTGQPFSRLRVTATAPSVYGPNVSEVCIATDDTRTFDVFTLAPNAAGDTHSWINDYTTVDEEELNSTDFQASDVAGQEEMLNLTDLPAFVPDTAGVRALEVWRYATRGAAGPTGYQPGLKTNGVAAYRTAEVLDEGWSSRPDLYLVNPVTGVPFTKAEIQALQAAKKSA